MPELQIYQFLLRASAFIAVATFIALFFVSAPYGRHIRTGWGPLIANRFAWFIMEMPSPLLMVVLFVIGSAPKTVTTFLFLCLWLAHYLHRAFIYPFMIKDGNKKMPLSVMGLALVFNVFNGYLNGRYLFTFSGGYSLDWMKDARFVVGIIIFVTGFTVNRWSDDILRKLRSLGESGYKIPYGGLYRWISCPNYFGEIVEWIGWALVTCSEKNI